MTQEQYDTVTGEVVHPVQTLARVPVATSGGPDLLEILNKRNHLLERVLDYAISATHPEQWFDLGGKPWPGGPACESMARRCGVSVTSVRTTKRPSSDDKGEFYLYLCEGVVSLPSGFDSIEALGTCSSRDTFLGTETNAGRELSEVDEGSILKAAYTNMIVNGVTRLLGVRSLSWDRLATLGLERGKMGKVEFNAGAKGGGQKAAGSDLVFKFGPGKDKKVSDATDDDLAWYVPRFEKDLGDPEKAKFKKNTETQLATVKAEQARRANAKAGTTAMTSTAVSLWARIQQLLTEAKMDPAKHGEFVKSVTKKVGPNQLLESDVAAVHDALDVLEKEKSQAGENFE